jgi:hypothetical protein
MAISSAFSRDHFAIIGPEDGNRQILSLVSDGPGSRNGKLFFFHSNELQLRCPQHHLVGPDDPKVNGFFSHFSHLVGTQNKI